MSLIEVKNPALHLLPESRKTSGAAALIFNHSLPVKLGRPWRLQTAAHDVPGFYISSWCSTDWNSKPRSTRKQQSSGFIAYLLLRTEFLGVYNKVILTCGATIFGVDVHMSLVLAW